MLNIKRARRRPFDVDYVDVTADNLEDVAGWCGGVIGGEGNDRYVRIVDKNAMNARQNKAFIGDRMLKSQTGFKSYGIRAFYKSFDELPEAPYGDGTEVFSHSSLPRDADPS